MKKTAPLYVYDLDGTCCDASWRHKLAGPEPDRSDKKAYSRWLRKVQTKKMLLLDKPVPGMKELVCATKGSAIYLTARNEGYRSVTETWLKKHGFPNIPLHMRPKKNKDRAADFKEAVIKAILKKDKVVRPVMLFDDDVRGEIEAMAKKNGYSFLKAKSG